MLPLLLFLLIIVSSTTVVSSQPCNNSLYFDKIVTYSNQSTQPLCSGLRHEGCTSLSFPACDTTFTSVLSGSVDEVSSCNSCKPGWYLPEGPVARLCSSNGGPGGVAAPYYKEQKVCKMCRAATGVCTAAGTTLEVCMQTGRTTDAQCVPCRNAPTNASYTGPSPTNLGVCPYECNKGYYLAGNGASCVTCGTDPCPVGQYRVGCTGISSGTCASCTSKPALFATYTSAGIPATENNCKYTCNTGYFRTFDGQCQSYLALNLYACPLGTQLVSSLCTPCPTPLPLNGKYVLDDGALPQKGGLCDWECKIGYYRSGGQCVSCSNPATKCVTGYYVQSECTGSSDVVCAPCNAFPLSMSSVATYRSTPQIDGNYGFDSMCVWDCGAGFTKPGGSTVPACARCTNKPLNAVYTQVF